MKELIRITGVDDLFTLIHFLDDKPKFKAHMDKMEALRKQLNDNVRAVGKINEIDSIKAKAQSDRQMAGEQLAKATVDAGVVLSDADEIKKKALAATRTAKKKDDALTLREQAIQNAQSLEDQNLRRREAASDRTMKAAEKALAKSKTVMSDALAIKADYEAKIAALQGALRVATG